jgi:hypothetical protein
MSNKTKLKLKGDGKIEEVWNVCDSHENESDLMTKTKIENISKEKQKIFPN